jgi:hypothetical protein
MLMSAHCSQNIEWLVLTLRSQLNLEPITVNGDTEHAGIIELIGYDGKTITMLIEYLECALEAEKRLFNNNDNGIDIKAHTGKEKKLEQGSAD